jgi:Chaperone of endosialidase
MKNPITIFTIILLGWAFVLVLPEAHAVTPAPDGGYPGGNTAEGENALLSLSAGTYNTAVGFLSLRSDTSGNFNTGLGAGTLLANTGDQNTATGAGALLSNTSGILNTAAGGFALFNNTIAGANAAFGNYALLSNTEGGNNTAVGVSALQRNTSGDSNTAVGLDALQNNTTGARNTALGINAGFNVTTATNVICIGAIGDNVDNSCFIDNILGSTLAIPEPVMIDSNTGQLGTTTSSRRFKRDIRVMESASESILALKPVTFYYKSDKTNTPQFGLIAEEVAEVNPALVLLDKEGKPHTVRYDAVNAMLLNEFLKEHRKMQKLEVAIAHQRNDFEATIAELKKEIANIAARSNGHEKQVQRVNPQIERSKAAPGTVASK